MYINIILINNIYNYIVFLYLLMQEDKISHHSSAGTINSGSQSQCSSPLAELDEEYKHNDNNSPPPVNKKNNPVSEIPIGWIMQTDPTSGLPCFVNQSTGSKVNKILFLF